MAIVLTIEDPQRIDLPYSIAARTFRTIVRDTLENLAAQAEGEYVSLTTVAYCVDCVHGGTEFGLRKPDASYYIRSHSTPGCNHINLRARVPDTIKAVYVPTSGVASDDGMQMLNRITQALASRLNPS